jgi:exonuclease SbcD
VPVTRLSVGLPTVFAVRILHTSDWHLGRSFHRVDLLSAQAQQFDHLVEVVAAEQVDVVVVAGDVYDRALPGVDAVALLDEGLLRLCDAGATVVVSSGNHDSARRLGFGSRLLAKAGLHVRTDPARVGEPVLLEDRHGPVAIYPLPYLEPSLAAETLCAERSQSGVLTAAMAAVSADLAQRPAGTRSVVSAHAFVTGGAASDSERELAVGGLGQVPMSTFAGVDYVALGHLHGRQQLAPTVRYSGSPLAFSFSEANQHKGSWLVELGKDGVQEVQSVEAPVPRPLARLRATLEELLTSSKYTDAESCWCQVTLTDSQRPAEPMERLRKRFPHVLELRLEPAGVNAGTSVDYGARTSGLGDLDVCCGFLEHVRQRPASAPESRLLQQALEASLLDRMEGVREPARAARKISAEDEVLRMLAENVPAAGGVERSA